MSDQTHLFFDASTLDFPIIDGDAHVNEPPDLWQKRVPAKWRERAPKVLHTENGDVWSFDDGKRLRPLGLTAVAGESFLEFQPAGKRYSEIRPGSFDTKARIVDLDIDGIWAQVLYPSVTLTGAAVYAEERELQRSCVRAYNEWLLEFCEGSGGRLIPQAIIPTTGTKDALEELRWAIDRGHKGAVISAFPNGSIESAPAEDEAFWKFAAETRLPIAVHIGSFIPATASGGGKTVDMQSLAFCGRAGASKAGGHTLPVVCELLFADIFTRHPDVKIVLVESNIGWIPTLLEQVDDMFLRYRFFTKAVEQMKTMPSKIFHRNFWATFMIDTVGIELRHRMNIDHLMWSTDYPHTGCDWPNSRTVIERVFRGVPRDQVRKMLCDNAAALYGIKLDNRASS
jgi:predicted TIM-barrel fold metal-dependent hydrolase